MRKNRARINKAIAVAASLALVMGLMPLPAVAVNPDENGAAEGQPTASTAPAPDSDANAVNATAPRAGNSGVADPNTIENGSDGDEAADDVGEPRSSSASGLASIQSQPEQPDSSISQPGEVQPEQTDAVTIQSQPEQPDSLAAQSLSVQNEDPGVKIEKHDPYKHAKDSYIRQAWGPNTVLIHCEWEYQFPVSWADKQICQFHEWPLIVMSRPDDYYDGTPKEAYFNWMTMKDYPFGKQYEGFPYDFAEWDGTFTYTGINGTVEYGPTTNAPIGEGTYYVYATVRIPSAATMFSDGTFILGKTFTIEPSAYNVTFDANVPNSASTTATGTMPTIHFNSRVETRQLPPNQFILPGYTFESWNTKPDGTGDRYENNAMVKNLSYGYGGRDVTLFAQWKPKEYTITYSPGDADGVSVTESAVFDAPGKLKAVAEMGWNYASHSFLGWVTTGFALLFDDQEEFVNLGGAPSGYYNDPPNVELVANWVENGEIVVSVTKDGMPQEGLGECFSLISSSGTTYTMPTTYQDGRYVFDPNGAKPHGGIPEALPSGEYDLHFEAAAIPGSAGYPESSVQIEYGDSYAVSTVFDYYTVSMEKDPAFAEACEIVMAPGEGADMGGSVSGKLVANARDGGKLLLTTNAYPGYHFDGYSAVGVVPEWEGDDPMKAEQTVEVQGQAEIMAHVAANTYTVHFDANTDAAVIGKMEDQDMVYDEPQNLFANKFVRSGAVFAGWNTKADGTGATYQDGQSVQNLTTENGGVVTLYAQWKEAPVTTAMLAFDLGGGTLDGQTGSITVMANVGDVIEMPAAPTREGYAFKYWKGSEFYPGDKYKVEGDHTFTAVWEKSAAPNPDKPDAKPAAPNPGKPDAKPAVPATGDAMSIAVIAFAILAIGSLIALAACALKRKRSRESR